jgi:hypothetical protein
MAAGTGTIITGITTNTPDAFERGPRKRAFFCDVMHAGYGLTHGPCGKRGGIMS